MSKSAQAIQPDFERVKNAMKMVWKHKMQTNGIEPSEQSWDILAEAAVKTMWLIEAELQSPNNTEKNNG